MMSSTKWTVDKLFDTKEEAERYLEGHICPNCLVDMDDKGPFATQCGAEWMLEKVNDV